MRNILKCVVLLVGLGACSISAAQSEFDDPLSDVAGIRAPLKPPITEQASAELVGAPWGITFSASYGHGTSATALGAQFVFVDPKQRWRIAAGASQRNPEAVSDNVHAFAVGADYSFDPIGNLAYSFGVELGRVLDIENSIDAGFGFEYGLSEKTALSLNLGYGHSDPEVGLSQSDVTSSIGVGHKFSEKVSAGLSFEPENDLNGRDTWRLAVTAHGWRLTADDHDTVGLKWIVKLN